MGTVLLGSLEFKGEEGRRALPAVTMLRTGNGVLPYVGGEPYFNKPPFGDISFDQLSGNVFNRNIHCQNSGLDIRYLLMKESNWQELHDCETLKYREFETLFKFEYRHKGTFRLLELSRGKN